MTQNWQNRVMKKRNSHRQLVAEIVYDLEKIDYLSATKYTIRCTFRRYLTIQLYIEPFITLR